MTIGKIIDALEGFAPLPLQDDFDNSGLQDALARADRAEQKALQVLAGKFGPM